MIQGMVVKAAVKLLSKQFKLENMDRIIKYMDEPNDADVRIDELEKRINKLEKQKE